MSLLGGAAAEHLLVVNKGDQQLGLIDLDGGVQSRVVTLSGYTGHEVSVASDGIRAFVPIYSDAGVGVAGFDGHTIDVIDLASGALLRTHDLGIAVRPHCVVTGGDGLLYVTAEKRNQVLLLNEETLELVGTIPTGAEQSHMLALSADRRIGCTANVEPGSVSVLDIASRSLRGVVPVSARANRIALSADGLRAYTADQLAPRIAVVDTEGLVVREWIPLPSVGFGSAVTRHEALVVALRRENAVAIVDLARPERMHVVPVPAGPQMIVLDDAHERAYTACHVDGVVVEIDLLSGQVTATVPVGRDPDGLCWIGSR